MDKIITVSTNIMESFRVNQLKSMFDLPIKEKLSHKWEVKLPIEDFDWNIGLIVGPSGSGKSTLAKQMFNENLHKGFDWSKDKAIIDDFPAGCGVKEITAVLNSVGFSSPPSWLKPFEVLSNGEKFRAEMARAIIEYKEKEFFVIDEFSSVVDRTVAKIGSFAISKAIRRNKSKMIALSCHYDIVEWLEADWVLDMRDVTFRRGLLRRPKIELSIVEIERDYWKMFAQHHYLTPNLSKTSKPYGCMYGNQLVSFAAILPAMGLKKTWRVHRIVVLPDFQGCGIGMNFLNGLGKIYEDKKLKLRITSSHPGIIRGLERNKNWQCTNFWKCGTNPHSKNREIIHRKIVPLASFLYINNNKRNVG